MLKDAWTLAIETLSIIELQRLSERSALARVAKNLNITNPNALRFAYGLVVETVRRKNIICKFVNNVIKPRTLEDFRLDVSAFLQLYVYQARVARNWAQGDSDEATRMAKLARAILGWKTLMSAESFLGLLLTCQLDPTLREASDEARIALTTFHPVWFVEYCIRLFGRSEAIDFLEGSIIPPPTFIRLNTLKDSRKEILARLDRENVKIEETEALKYVYKVTQTKRPLVALESFREGLFYVQDKASCYAAEVAHPKQGEIVFEICAAPGAKTIYLAQLMQNRGSIYSLDYSARRVRIWKQEVKRMSVYIAEPVVADARTDFPFVGNADAVILDPPCTSTGVFGRQPSAKWRLTKASIERMAGIQWQMITRCADGVKAKGSLTYSTCSVTVEENEMIIERFLKHYPEFHLVDVNPKLGLPGLRGLVSCRRLYPNLHESNGFFVAKLARI